MPGRRRLRLAGRPRPQAQRDPGWKAVTERTGHEPAVIDADQVPETLASRAARLFAAFQAGDAEHHGRSGRAAHADPVAHGAGPAARSPVRRGRDPGDLARARAQLRVHHRTRRRCCSGCSSRARREAWRVTKREDRVDPTDFDADDLATDPDDTPEDLVLRHDNDVPAVAAHRATARTLPRAAARDRLRRPPRLRRRRRIARHAGRQHRPDPRPVPGQAARCNSPNDPGGRTA